MEQQPNSTSDKSPILTSNAALALTAKEIQALTNNEITALTAKEFQALLFLYLTMTVVEANEYAGVPWSVGDIVRSTAPNGGRQDWLVCDGYFSALHRGWWAETLFEEAIQTPLIWERLA